MKLEHISCDEKTFHGIVGHAMIESITDLYRAFLEGMDTGDYRYVKYILKANGIKITIEKENQ